MVDVDTADTYISRLFLDTQVLQEPLAPWHESKLLQKN